MEAEPKTASYGRPRLLTHEEILGGAVELGLENVTMKKLSSHLGVGTATLYQYFDSRKALMRAAAVYALSDVSLPEDTGQHWSMMARDYVLGLMDLLANNPTYINSMSPTDFGFEVHFKLVEPFLAGMNKRGIAPKDAMRLFNSIGIIAYGGAVETVRQREFEFQDETMDVVARRQFARLDVKEFPHLREALDEFTQTPEQKVSGLMRSAFSAFARYVGMDDEKLFEEAA
ncbi:MAG: helix-turn-helix transcriptional regulator [Hellea sp.]|nr:helix-turn-helix transcriptional regulator [Hellea sp.]